jgi:hypothetical protein
MLAKDVKTITESGKPLEQAEDIKFLRQENDRIVFQAGSGKYAFASETK